MLKALVGAGAVLLIFNEIRGLILAGPVLYGVWQAGGTLAALWVGASSLGGIALSVAVPAFLLRGLDKRKPPPKRGFPGGI